ncbi:MAG: beta-galactosidase [Kiritimatiellae bacterium]|nr:beta-galactosidase [Kiritimatiellia bacterium]
MSMLVSLLFVVASFTAAAQPFTSARWIWAQPREAPPTNAYLRVRIEATKPVRKAWFFCIQERQRRVTLNGKPLALVPYPANRERRGHVRSCGRDLTSLLTPGENVLVFEHFRCPKGCYGLLLRGAVEYADGTSRQFCSSAKDFEGAATLDGPWSPAWEQGDATMVPWTRYGETVRQFATEQELEQYLGFMHEGNGTFPAARLAQEPESPNARIVYSGILPAIETNGRILPPYRSTECEFAPAAEDEAFIRQCERIGLHLYSLPRFRNNQMSTSQSTWDFRSMDDAMRRILQLDPEARFSLYNITGRHLPDGWLDAHPDELCEYAVKSEKTHEYGGNIRTVSFASEAYRELERNFWRAFGAFAKDKPWRRRLVMVHCGFGGSGDGMPCGCHTMPDTGKRMTERFRAFLKAKYATDAALQKAWADGMVSIDSVRVPNAAERWGTGRYVKDASDPRDVRVLDYYDCYHSVFEEFILEFGKAVKAALPGTLVGAYHGYVILGYTPEGSTAKYDRILQSPYIDYFYATTRGYNLVDGLFRDLAQPMRAVGKMVSIEGDVRTHVALGQGEEKWRCKTPAETRATVGKFVANALIQGTGWHVVDFGNAWRTRWFNCPEALEPLAAGIRAWKRLYAAGDVKQAADVAIVIDPKDMWRSGYPDFDKNRAVFDDRICLPLQALNLSGFAYDLYAPADLASAPNTHKAVFRLGFTGEAAPKTAAEWAKALAARGCHAYTRPGFYVQRNSKLLLVFVPKNATVPGESKGVKDMLDQTGLCAVTLERPCRCATDVLTGEVVARETGRFTLQSGEPRLWLLEVE